ncbi:hypothetical protein VTK56DRAFT_6902 [Thermocarpiscus australiensis]
MPEFGSRNGWASSSVSHIRALGSNNAPILPLKAIRPRIAQPHADLVPPKAHHGLALAVQRRRDIRGVHNGKLLVLPPFPVPQPGMPQPPVRVLRHRLRPLLPLVGVQPLPPVLVVVGPGLGLAEAGAGRRAAAARRAAFPAAALRRAAGSGLRGGVRALGL